MNTKCSETSFAPLTRRPQMFNVWSTLTVTRQCRALTYATLKILIVIHLKRVLISGPTPGIPQCYPLKAPKTDTS
jgi:hypothetical protein